MTEDEKSPFEEMTKKNKEKYVSDMEIYKQKKEEEAENLKKEEDELKKIQKHEALQLLKKKEKAENIIRKAKGKRQRKEEKEEKNADSNKPKRPASSFLLFSKEARSIILEERPEVNNSTLKALIAVKWKELGAEEKQCGMLRLQKQWKHTRRKWKSTNLQLHPHLHPHNNDYNFEFNLFKS